MEKSSNKLKWPTGKYPASDLQMMEESSNIWPAGRYHPCYLCLGCDAIVSGLSFINKQLALIPQNAP